MSDDDKSTSATPVLRVFRMIGNAIAILAAVGVSIGIILVCGHWYIAWST